VDPASTNNAVLYEGLFEFQDLKHTATGLCVDAEGYDSRNGTALVSWTCHGGRNQGFWYDEERRSLHVELSHDRCVDVEDGRMQAGTPLVLWDCHGGLNQEFVTDATGIHPAGHTNLCIGFNATATGSPLVLTSCGTSAGAITLADRNYATTGSAPASTRDSPAPPLSGAAEPDRFVVPPLPNRAAAIAVPPPAPRRRTLPGSRARRPYSTRPRP
jgi:hypothetical protein